ncbi:MAG: hypothetical protein LBC64_07600 [Fibromonadaceae bacterium]|jgi:hypothetical protein|nr:hypothetical protein [Fibromonadaceae bacterium]
MESKSQAAKATAADVKSGYGWLVEAKTKKGSYVKVTDICEWAKSAKERYETFKKKYPDCNVNVYKLVDVTKEFEGVEK